MKKQTVFISWSDDGIGHEFAVAFCDTFLTAHPELDGFVSPSIAGSRNWFKEIMSYLDRAEYAIACLTPGATTSTWFNFEVGLLYQKLETKLKLLKFHEFSSDHPLAHLQAFRHDNQDDLIHLFEEITSGKREVAEGWVRRLFPSWLLHVERFETVRRSTRAQVLAGAVALAGVGKRLRDAIAVNNTPLFHFVVQRALQDAYQRFHDAEHGLAIPATEYPHYLIALHRQFDPAVKALAVVEHAEHFWLGPLGDQIANATRPERTERIFVFYSPDVFDRYYEKLLKYARHYTVYAMSYTTLSREFTITADFSVIDDAGPPRSKMLAVYDDTAVRPGAGGAPSLRFLTDHGEIVKYEHEFRNMTRVARRLGAEKNEDRDEVCRDVFEPAVLTHYEQVQVEMSRYIPIHDYDKYEERHAYYLEMMSRMIERFRQACPAGREVCVAELGAGTGLFTRKLAQALGPDSGVHIDAVELDAPCFYLLDHKMREFRDQVTCYHRDSRKPLPGSYQCIFTSFADHHIHPRDKKAYFRNIKKHLRPGGLFIVGDEFLRDHDRSNRKEREDALNAYHKYIIQLAREAQQKIKEQVQRDGSPPGPDSARLLEDFTGYGKLAELEELALKSGLEGREFKLSCAEYEGYLGGAGFGYEKELIGPKSGTEEIGGIYVYVARAAQ